MAERTNSGSEAADWQALLEKMQLQSNEWGFVSTYGTGDAYFIGALARQFTQLHGGKMVMVGTAPHCEVARLFPVGVSRVVAVDHVDRRTVDRFGVRRKGGLFVAHPAHDQRQLVRKLGANGYRMIDMYREYLGLSPTAQLDKPEIPQAAVEEAHRELARLRLPAGRTVVLAPVTRSIPMIEFPWAKLVARLRQRGWAVATNVAAGEAPIPDTAALQCSLTAVIPLVEQAGWLIAMRSGICDVVATAACRMSILYPRFKWYAGSLMDGASIRQMGLNNTACECEIAPATDQEQLVSLVVEGQLTS